MSSWRGPWSLWEAEPPQQERVDGHDQNHRDMGMAAISARTINPKAGWNTPAAIGSAIAL